MFSRTLLLRQILSGLKRFPADKLYFPDFGHTVLHDLLQQRNQILNHADLLIGDQDSSVVQIGHHLIQAVCRNKV